MRPASKRALLSEPTPNSTFPTDQVPPPAMRDTTTAAAPPLSAPTVQDPREQRGAAAGPPATSCATREPSVIAGPSNLRTQSVTLDSISNDSVTVPNTQRNAPNNNSSKLDRLDIPQYLNNDNNKSTTPTFERLLTLTRRTLDLERQGLCPPMRLRGGGESAATGWGTPPSNNANNNNANSTSGWGTANPANQGTAGTQQWNNNANRTAPTAQDAQTKSNPNSNLPAQPAPAQPAPQGWGPSAKPAAIQQAAAPAAGAAAGPPPNSTTKQQLEQLTNMREAIFSQDGWGGQHVNQDTTWDIPSSPEPSMKMDATGAPQWKPNVNNGTELWEANLRNGGQPPPPPTQKTPWGHTPTTNIGGTWGEDDDGSESSNVWTGAPPNNQVQWAGNPAAANGGALWGGPKKENEWGSAGWVDPRAADPRAGAAGMDPRDIRSEQRDMRAGSTDPMRMLDPRDPRSLVTGDMRGDPRGITGRLNGAGTEGFWTQPPQGPHHIHQSTKIMGPGGGGGNGAGWEEPSPPSQRRNVPYDDGTSVWSSHAQPQRGMSDLPTGGSMGRGGAGPPGMAPSRLKPDGSGWGHGARNGSWEEGGHSGWDESSPWPKQKQMGGPLWGDNEMEWSHKQGPKQTLSKEIIWNSKEFRSLVDMGYKKEDVENALRMRGMSVDDALDMLTPLRMSNLDGWRGHARDEYDHQGSGQFPGQRFPPGPSGQIPYPLGTNTSNILNNVNAAPGCPSGSNAANAANTALMNMSPSMAEKILAQPGGRPFPGGPASSTRSPLAPPQSQPSTQQLRMLVQQIQLAVQNGYLNHQILNQPLAPQTLILLNQLLQHIKTLQNLLSQQQNFAQQNQGLGGKNVVLHCSVMITKTKQQIQNLQNQIAAQQAVYVKQQQHNMGGNGGNPGDIFKNDSINALQGNFGDLAIKDPQVQSYQQQQQSRLNQWKLPPALDKDPLADSNSEFSRAPGSVSKPLAPSHCSPNMNPLGLTQPDGPWSSGRAGDTGGWPDPNSGGNDSGNSDPKDTQWSAPVCQPSQQSLTDLVPEFEPGKPWKGSQIKSVEDDPTITPGSVARSPLSVGLKDTELFGSMNPSKLSPTSDSNLQPLSLSSSTWSFNPPSSTSSAFTSKLPTSKGVLGDLNPPTTVTSELWPTSQLSKARGPPPGLAKGGSGVNGWSGLPRTGGVSWGAQGSGGNWGGSGSPWLLLRNLTAQIDGSTLRTLCMQHGPLQSFHLYLHQGFALAKYSSREEATKAQTALNNCVLGNTTILAESPTDWDANALLQHVATPQGASTASWRGGASAKQQPVAAGDTWSTGWPSNSGNSLWGNAPLDSAEQARATPSNLNSYLPPDLLGGESM